MVRALASVVLVEQGLNVLATCLTFRIGQCLVVAGSEAAVSEAVAAMVKVVTLFTSIWMVGHRHSVSVLAMKDIFEPGG